MALQCLKRMTCSRTMTLVPEEIAVSAEDEEMARNYVNVPGWKLFATCLAALVAPVETTSPFEANGQCLEADRPEEILEYWDFLWFLVLVLVSLDPRWIPGLVAWRPKWQASSASTTSRPF